MSTRISLGAGAKDGRHQVMWKDGERVLHRGLRADRTRAPHSVLALRLIAKSPLPVSLDRLAHEYGLKDHLDSAWAAGTVARPRRDDAGTRGPGRQAARTAARRTAGGGTCGFRQTAESVESDLRECLVQWGPEDESNRSLWVRTTSRTAS